MKNIIVYSFILFFAGISLVSCLGDLDTMPLDDNQLVSEKVYQTKDGYTGVLAKCYASLVLTGQKGGDGGDGDLEGANEGYSGYVRLLFYLQELSTDNFLMPSSSNGLRKCLNLQWDASNASVITWTYQRLYMSIAYCNELLRECTEGKLQSRGLWEEMKDDYVSYRAEARFIRAYCYSMLCDLFGAVPYVDENTGVKEIPVQYTRKQIFEFAESELLAIENELKAPGSNEYGRVDRVAGWFLLARMYLNAQTWINENKYQEAYAYAVKVIADGHYPLASDYREIFLADNNTCKEIIWPLVQDGLRAQSSAGTNFYVKAFVNGPMDELYKTGVGSRGWGNVRAKVSLVDAFDADDVMFDGNDTWGNNKKDKRAQFMTALPNQVKDTWDVNMDMTSTFTCGYGYIKWRNVTKEDELCPSGDAYTSIDFPLFRTADAYLMAAEAILRGANGTQSEALGYVFWVLPLVFIFLNLFMIPRYQTTLRTGRVLQGYIVISIALLLLLLWFNAIFLLMATSLNRNARLQQENQLLFLQQQRYENLKTAIEEVRQARHDMRHQLNQISALAETGDLEGLKSYLEKNISRIPNLGIHFCENRAADSVIGYYCALAKREDIPFCAKLDLPQTLPIDEINMCLVLSNLLENALEASIRTAPDRRQIKITAYLHAGRLLLIEVENAYDGEIREKNGVFQSSKRKGNGVGIQSIQHIAEKSGGASTFACQNGVFSAKVMLCG